MTVTTTRSFTLFTFTPGKILPSPVTATSPSSSHTFCNTLFQLPIMEEPGSNRKRQLKSPTTEAAAQSPKRQKSNSKRKTVGMFYDDETSDSVDGNQAKESACTNLPPTEPLNKAHPRVETHQRLRTHRKTQPQYQRGPHQAYNLRQSIQEQRRRAIH